MRRGSLNCQSELEFRIGKVLQELKPELQFSFFGRPSISQSIGLFDARLVINAAFLNARRECFGLREHKRTVEHEQFLRRSRCYRPFFRVDIGVGVIELHQSIVELESAHAGIDRPPMIFRIAYFKGLAAFRFQLARNEHDRVAPFLD